MRACARHLLTDHEAVRLPSGFRAWIGTCEGCGRPFFLNENGDPVERREDIDAERVRPELRRAS